MDVNLKIKPNLEISAFYLFFIITSIQTGVGILSVPKHVFSHAKQDAWISILLAYVFMLLVVTVIFAILNQYENTDIFGIHEDIFGKWLGRFMGTGYIILIFIFLLSVILSYIKLIQIFIHPTISSYIIGGILLSITFYGVLGGIRVVVGVVFIFFLSSSWIFFLLYDPMNNIEFTHFFPMFEATFPKLVWGARETTYTFLGFDILFFIYPFIKNKNKAKLPVYLGVSYTALFVFITTIVSIGYYSSYDFEKMEWPVLILLKSVSFTFLERFDYLIIIEWVMVVTTTIILYMWAITFGLKRLYQIRQKTALIIVSVILFILSSSIKDIHVVNKITDIISQIGFWVVFIYPFLLLPIVICKKKWRKFRKEAKE